MKVAVQPGRACATGSSSCSRLSAVLASLRRNVKASQALFLTATIRLVAYQTLTDPWRQGFG
jgi:hypothetical protein